MSLHDGPYRGKRIFDLTLLALAAIPGSLIAAVCVIAIRLSSRGPIFFVQERVGMNGRLFRVIKFRSMHTKEGANSVFPDQASITGAGRWMRRFSLDELPQLLNVFRGEMSIVGPRPTLPYQVERYSQEERGRLAVRPGLTGLAQVKGRNSIPWAARIQYDLEYVRNQSFLLDLKIVLQTFSAVASGGGVEGHPKDDPLARI